VERRGSFSPPSLGLQLPGVLVCRKCCKSSLMLAFFIVKRCHNLLDGMSRSVVFIFFFGVFYLHQCGTAFFNVASKPIIMIVMTRLPDITVKLYILVVRNTNSNYSKFARRKRSFEHISNPNIMLRSYPHNIHPL
jgi:hypothetical protein